MADTIFYSWQSDLPVRENRQLIRDALEAAITETQAALGVEDALRLDQDTKDVPGNPVIVDTILEKIRSCRIFAPDLSYVATTDKGKKVPNPNVLLELGFALEVLGDRKSLIVMNDYYGTPKELPFDIGGRRYPITYTLGPDASRDDLRATRNRLVRQLASALKAILVAPVPTQSPWYHEPVYGRTSYLQNGEVVVRRTATYGNRPAEEMTWSNGAQGFIHLIPANDMQFKRVDLDQLVNNLCPMTRDDISYNRGRNTHGACVYAAPEDSTDVLIITQLFQTGELWAMNKAAFSREHLPMLMIQQVYQNTLKRLLSAAMSIKLAAPIQALIGIGGVRGKKLGIAPSRFSQDCLDDEFIASGVFPNYEDQEEVRKVVQRLLAQVCDSAGVRAPETGFE